MLLYIWQYNFKFHNWDFVSHGYFFIVSSDLEIGFHSPQALNKK